MLFGLFVQEYQYCSAQLIYLTCLLSIAAFDKHMNILLVDCKEFRVLEPNGNAPKVDAHKKPGLVLLRGEQVITVTMRAPPTTVEGPRVPIPSLTLSGSGFLRAAGRGIRPGSGGVLAGNV